MKRHVFWESANEHACMLRTYNYHACILRPCECTGMYFEILRMTRFVFSDLANAMACILKPCKWPDVYFETLWINRCIFWDPANNKVCILRPCEWPGLYSESKWSRLPNREMQLMFVINVRYIYGGGKIYLYCCWISNLRHGNELHYFRWVMFCLVALLCYFLVSWHPA